MQLTSTMMTEYIANKYINEAQRNMVKIGNMVKGGNMVKSGDIVKDGNPYAQKQDKISIVCPKQ